MTLTESGIIWPREIKKLSPFTIADAAYKHGPRVECVTAFQVLRRIRLHGIIDRPKFVNR
jgi:hypothetical protein